MDKTLEQILDELSIDITGLDIIPIEYKEDKKVKVIAK